MLQFGACGSSFVPPSSIAGQEGRPEGGRQRGACSGGEAGVSRELCPPGQFSERGQALGPSAAIRSPPEHGPVSVRTAGGGVCCSGLLFGSHNSGLAGGPQGPGRGSVCIPRDWEPSAAQFQFPQQVLQASGTACGARHSPTERPESRSRTGAPRMSRGPNFHVDGPLTRLLGHQ